MALLASLLSLTACGGGSPAPSAERGSRTARAANAAAGESAPAASPAPAGASATAARPADGRACEPRRLRALFIGTSLTAGYGLDDPSLAYPAVLQRMADSAGYDVEIVNAGVSGETSAGALRRTPWLLRTPADVVVLETGANDGLRAFDPDSTRANLRAILDRAHAALPRARLLLVQMEAPPNLGASYTARFRGMFPEVARESGATLVPFLLKGVAGQAELNQGDGIHPNAAGARRVAANIWPTLAGALRALDPCQEAK